MTHTEKNNLYGFSPSQLKDLFIELNHPAFRAVQTTKWLYQKNVDDFSSMTNLSQTAIADLSQRFFIKQNTAMEEHLSTDGTIKWLFSCSTGAVYEAVYIPEVNRATLCISSQVGCGLNCSFCATGKMGFIKNLTSAEILSQVGYAQTRVKSLNLTSISNIVFMGMGEPLANTDSVFPVLEILLHDTAFNFARRKVTVSTSGVIPNIYKLMSLNFGTSLALSLHAPTDELRQQLVPINRKFPIKELLEACWEYRYSQNLQSITIEYIMLRDVNDNIEQAKQLVKILRDCPVKINLIPFNPIEFSDYQTTPMQQIEQFMNYLKNNGLFTTIRKNRGGDINSACGQLAGTVRFAS